MNSLKALNITKVTNAEESMDEGDYYAAYANNEDIHLSRTATYTFTSSQLNSSGVFYCTIRKSGYNSDPYIKLVFS